MNVVAMPMYDPAHTLALTTDLARQASALHDA
jgi:hypothetical protein